MFCALGWLRMKITYFTKVVNQFAEENVNNLTNLCSTSRMIHNNWNDIYPFSLLEMQANIIEPHKSQKPCSSC
ncbi:hypothetical protein AQUCO_08200008v1 [Aquilegia coerulea]|uniref:Uncharacterized protein n=1 Tax=Aquilegia coerulea TaxID=218851 RepID=A0A2G5C7C9_AQUCA|nr:hypothetical protein AQUCO_08200008v1 [Aquilegia coerulea]